MEKAGARALWVIVVYQKKALTGLRRYAVLLRLPFRSAGKGTGGLEEWPVEGDGQDASHAAHIWNPCLYIYLGIFRRRISWYVLRDP